jgi:stage V sporulation protein B
MDLVLQEINAKEDILMTQVEIKRRRIQSFSSAAALVGFLFIGEILQDNGIAYIAAAYEIFSLVWILAEKYAPDTIAAILRPKNVKSQYRNIVKVRHRIITLSVILGLAGTAVTAFGGYALLSKVFKLPNSAYIVLILAPAFLLRSINSALLGVFQGEGSQLPTSVASVLRVMLSIGFTFLFGIIFKNYGIKVSTLLMQDDFTGMYASFGAALAISLAELFILIFLLIIYRGNVANTRPASEGTRQPESLAGFMKILYSGMSGIMLCSFLLRLPAALGLLLYMRHLSDDADMSAYTAVFGAYYGRYLALVMLAVMLIDIMLIPMTAKIYGYYRKSDVKPARVCFQGGVHMTVLWGAYISVMFSTLSEQIAGAISSTNMNYVAAMLKGGSFIVIFAALIDLFVRLLYMADKKYILYAVLAGTDLIFAILVSVLLNTADMGVLALVYGGLVCAVILFAVVGYIAVRTYGTGVDFIQIIAIPAGCACVCGLISLLMGKLITPYLGNAVSIILCFAVTFIIYMILLLFLRNFREQELKALPAGKLISAVGRMLHLL